MDGFSFFWIFWIFWILSTFFMKKNNARLKISVWLLIVIILSLWKFPIAGIEVSLASIFMLFTAYSLIIRENKKTAAYSFFISYIVMLSFAGFQLMELYDPVWIIFHRKWMLAAFIIYLIFLLQKSLGLQIAVLLAGTVHGDLLYGIMVRRITEYHAVSLMTLDVVAISLAFILLFHGTKEASVIFDQYFKQLEREKQKTQ